MNEILKRENLYQELLDTYCKISADVEIKNASEAKLMDKVDQKLLEALEALGELTTRIGGVLVEY